jgi:hypothetical protein
MKRRKLKTWVEQVLAIIGMIALIVAGSDSESTKIFIITHIIAGSVLALVGYILIKNNID